MTQLPVPARFHLDPDRWQPASEEERVRAGVAFLALAVPAPPAFDPNITVTGELRKVAELEQLAEETADQLGQSARVSDRSTAGDSEAPGLTQHVSFTLQAGERTLDLVQVQVILLARDEDDPGSAAVVNLLALTCLPDQLDGVIGDFREFVRSFSLGDPERLETS